MLTLGAAVALAAGLTVFAANDTIATDKAAASAKAKAAAETTETAIFAGGCFWCVESDFDKVDGVLDTESGYTGGTTENPTYKSVTYGDSGHYEAVRITYDPSVVDYRTLVNHFFRTVDPTDDGGQFCDRGHSYRTAIFAVDADQRAIAEDEKAVADEILGGTVVTPIIDASAFTRAEEYHQDYYLTNPLRYRYYRYACGRDDRVKELWGEEKPAG
ncbi:MAG: peptide-methionine (S)-S-oxide reductase MsrA [Pseudomonadota bacterium]